MRFGLIHRIMTDVLAALGLLSLLTSGELHRSVVIALVVALGLVMLLPERWQAHPRMRSFGVFSSLALLAVQAVRLSLGYDVLNVAVEFALGLQLIRLATRRGAAHDQQIVLLALLHLVAGTVLGGGLAYGLCFLGFLVVAPGALVLSHLRREVEGNYRQGARDRTGLPVDVPRILRSRRVISKRFLLATCSLAIPIFVFTALLFVFFPRVGLSLLLLNHQRSERMIGFSDRVDLGKVGRLRADTTIALRVQLKELPASPPPRIPLYLRGTAFDSYDGGSWSRDKTQVLAPRAGERVWLVQSGTPVGPELMTIDLEPIKPPVLFLPAASGAFDVLTKDDKSPGRPPRISRGREGDYEYVGVEDRGLRYTVYGRPRNARHERLLRSEAGRYLAVPQGLPERIGELARTWAGDAVEPREIAKRIEHQLETNYQYDLESPAGAAKNPLENFLFVSKRGHCEFYSTSMAVMLRTLGIPTRNVTGFIGGTFNRFGGFYAVRQGDAHSWVEVYLEDAGWVAFDPTPTSESAPRADVDGLVATLRDLVEAAGQRWNRNVIGYDLDQQLGVLAEVRRHFPTGSRAMLGTGWKGAVTGLLVFALAGGLAYRAYRRRRTKVAPRGAAGEMAPNAARIVALYQQLEAVLQTHRVARRPETTPLAHAKGLAAIGHPLGDEVLELTEIYLLTRFGGKELTDAEADDYTRRVKELGRREVPRAA